ncbi:MAG TPA: efflux RND transporter periplasmic adaptor subunit, partial [Gemmatimonadaceae bacterium]|nr:efflux RND transporter periplasmic adaptor subunit [Gemmatimonadaceae bacterium]
AVAERTGAVDVLVTTVKRAAATTELILPGTVQPLHEASVYAQTSGYVTRWYADMGARVKPGQVMAVIATPEVDQELASARAQLARVQATLVLDKANLDRWVALERDSAVSKEELDQHQSAYDNSNAAVTAARADVERFAALQNFARIVAPFGGVVTSRTLDVGTYVTPPGVSTATSVGGQNASTINKGLYSLAQVDTVRLLVEVPQTYAEGIKDGQTVDVTVQERPNRVFKGIVSRTAGALDPASRTLLTEVRIPNKDGALVAGLYAEAHFHADRVVAPLVVTASALVTRSDGIQVVEVRPTGAHYQHVALGRDYGATVELTDGATEGDTVVVNPSDDVIEGAKLHVLPPPPAPEH